VEFIRLVEWHAELRNLVAEICTQDTKTLYRVVPEAQRQPDAHAAWQKIEQVYGFGRLSRFPDSSPQQHVFDSLANDRRVVELLTPPSAEHLFNSHRVAEGLVVPGSREAKDLAEGREGGRLKKQRRSYGKAFRSKINSYVYRDGNGEKPQSWPLIRKVVLHGPWGVLSSGKKKYIYCC
jgi:hypothetical protein